MQSNEYIKTTLVAGKQYFSPAYKFLQCGEYLNNEFLAIREMGSYLPDAEADMKKYPVDKPQTGDCVFLNYGVKDKNGSIPHKAIVEATDGENVWLTEANFTGNGIVGHGRKMAIGDKHIIGFCRVPLNAKTQAGQPNDQVSDWAKADWENFKKDGIIKPDNNPQDVADPVWIAWVLFNLGVKTSQPVKEMTKQEFVVCLSRAMKKA
jgi:hypothetical protein